MNWTIFLTFLGVITVCCTIVVVLQLSDLSQQGIRATLRDYWQTFFSANDDLPSDPEQNPKLE